MVFSFLFWRSLFYWIFYNSISSWFWDINSFSNWGCICCLCSLIVLISFNYLFYFKKYQDCINLKSSYVVVARVHAQFLLPPPAVSIRFIAFLHPSCIDINLNISLIFCNLIKAYIARLTYLYMYTCLWRNKIILAFSIFTSSFLFYSYLSWYHIRF